MKKIGLKLYELNHKYLLENMKNYCEYIEQYNRAQKIREFRMESYLSSINFKRSLSLYDSELSKRELNLLKSD